jgi:hypothetical protein
MAAQADLVEVVHTLRAVTTRNQVFAGGPTRLPAAPLGHELEVFLEALQVLLVLDLLLEDGEREVVGDHILVLRGVHESLVGRDRALLARDVLVQKDGDVGIVLGSVTGVPPSWMIRPERSVAWFSSSVACSVSSAATASFIGPLITLAPSQYW